MIPFLLSVITIFIAIFLVFAVVIQNSKGGGLNNAFGASNLSAMIGNRKVAAGIEKITWWLGGLLMGFAFLTTVFTTTGPSGSSLLNTGTQATMSNPTAAPQMAPVDPGTQKPTP